MKRLIGTSAEKNMSMFDECPLLDSNNSSTDTYGQFNRICNGYLTFLFIFCGILGNSYSIYLLRRRFNVRATFSMYLRVLAMWDVLLLLCASFYYSLEACLPPLSLEWEYFFR